MALLAPKLFLTQHSSGQNPLKAKSRATTNQEETSIILAIEWAKIAAASGGCWGLSCLMGGACSQRRNMGHTHQITKAHPPCVTTLCLPQGLPFRCILTT